MHRHSMENLCVSGTSHLLSVFRLGEEWGIFLRSPLTKAPRAPEGENGRARRQDRRRMTAARLARGRLSLQHSRLSEPSRLPPLPLNGHHLAH